MDTARGGAHVSTEEAKAAAARLLRGQGARSLRDALSRHRLPALDIALQMVHDGWPVDEPFLSSVLRAVRHKLDLG